jgi:hypothetical protein
MLVDCQEKTHSFLEVILNKMSLARARLMSTSQLVGCKDRAFSNSDIAFLNLMKWSYKLLSVCEAEYQTSVPLSHLFEAHKYNEAEHCNHNEVMPRYFETRV